MSQSPFRSDILRNKKALITGGSSGICFEIARQLGLHGAMVTIVSRRESFVNAALESLREEGIEAFGCPGDVRNSADIQKIVDFAVRSMGGINILVNGAAGNFLANAADLSPKGFRTVMEIDTIGTFNMISTCFEQLKLANGACIINISANLHYGATWYQCHASAAKAALDSLTRSLALEWGAYNIRVLGIAPGPITDTPGLTKLIPNSDSKDVAEMIKETIPVGRLGTKWDIAMAAVFLCSNAGSFISGETLVVDGGQWLWKPAPIPTDSVTEFSRSMESKSRSMKFGNSKL